MHKVILLIGGNEGDRHRNITDALFMIEEKMGNVVQKSSVVESEPWGFEHQQDFLNQVLEINTVYSPQQLLKLGQGIEETLGRRPKTTDSYEGRTMDIDILYYQNEIINSSDLVIPHPKLHERKFTLLPLNELWSDYIHPVLKKSTNELLSECKDNGRAEFIKL